MNALISPARFVPASTQADYDAWLTKEVQDALVDPRPLVSHEDVLKRSSLRRVELLKRLELQAA